MLKLGRLAKVCEERREQRLDDPSDARARKRSEQVEEQRAKLPEERRRAQLVHDLVERIGRVEGHQQSHDLNAPLVVAAT